MDVNDMADTSPDHYTSFSKRVQNAHVTSPTKVVKGVCYHPCCALRVPSVGSFNPSAAVESQLLTFAAPDPFYVPKRGTAPGQSAHVPGVSQ